MTICWRLRVVYGRKCYSQATRTFKSMRWFFIKCDRRSLSSFELWHKTSFLLFTKRDTMLFFKKCDTRKLPLLRNLAHEGYALFQQVWHREIMLSFLKCVTRKLLLLRNLTNGGCATFHEVLFIKGAYFHEVWHREIKLSFMKCDTRRLPPFTEPGVTQRSHASFHKMWLKKTPFNKIRPLYEH